MLFRAMALLFFYTTRSKSICIPLLRCLILSWWRSLGNASNFRTRKGNEEGVEVHVARRGCWEPGTIPTIPRDGHPY